MQSMEGHFDLCTEQLFEVSLKLEEKEKAYNNTEGDVGGLSRRALLLEEDVERSEERLAKAVSELAKQSHRADHAVKKRIQLENDNSHKEDELERSNERCTNGEKKIIDLEEELKVVGQNLQQLEVSEEKALQREDNYQRQILDLMDRLKAAELREENATMNIQRLNVRIDQTEEDLLNEKLKIKDVSDNLDNVFNEMLN